MGIKGYMRGYREGRYSHPLLLLWRCICYLPLYSAGVVMFVAVAMGWGPSRAVQFWEENFP